MVKNEIVTEYRPIIGATALDLYNFYKQMANRKEGETLYPSMELTSTYLSIAKITISCNNWLLECCELLKIETGNARLSNRYTLLPVNPVTPELLARLTKLLQPTPEDGERWREFKANRLKAVQNWQPLRAHFKAKAAAPVEATPAPITQTAPETSPQTELVAQLVEQFKENKLSEAAASKMITDYGEEAVKQQLAWLPHRATDMPLRTLRAALKGDWDEPKPVGKPVMETEMMGAPPPNSPPQAASPPVETGPALSLPPDPQWQEVKARLEMQLPQATYNNWVKQTELVQIEGNQWLIQCESTFAQDWLENRLNGTLMRTVASVAGQAVELKFVVNDKELGKLNG